MPSKHLCENKVEACLLLGLINLRGGHFIKIFLIVVKCPLDSEKKSDWFRCKKMSQNLKCLNFKCEQSEKYFSSCCTGFTVLHMSHAKTFAGDKPSVNGNQALGSGQTAKHCLRNIYASASSIKCFIIWPPKNVLDETFFFILISKKFLILFINISQQNCEMANVLLFKVRFKNQSAKF